MSIFHLPVHLSSVFRVPYTRCTLRKIIHGVRSPLPTLHYITLQVMVPDGVCEHAGLCLRSKVWYFITVLLVSGCIINVKSQVTKFICYGFFLSFLIICCFFSNKIADKQLTFTSFKHTMNWKISKGASCCAWPKNTVSKAVMCCRRRYILPAASSCPQRWVISSPELRLRRSLVLNIISVIYPTLNLTEGTARFFIW